MRSSFAAWLVVVLLLGPVGQVLADCCAILAEPQPTLGAEAEPESGPLQPPCHGNREAAPMDEDRSHAQQEHPHDCASALDCCGSAVSAPAEASVVSMRLPSSAALALMPSASAHRIPDSVYRPPRSG
ncbi:MAG: hypothetical protein RJP96_02430 [Algiphilus sp.]|uniref:hypothetical protein n=1 Tax=Algiphilus sp. TaxID=1872431 RepID=UPI0032F03AF2